MLQAFTFDMAFLGLQISDNMHTTDEGFLICMNVPVARTGVQQYRESEILDGGDFNKIVNVYREANDVFSVDTLRSFEGKSVTDEHPRAGLVTPDNMTGLDCGHAQHARQDGKYIILDLMIKRKDLIEKVKDGSVREVSAGYCCEYTPYKDGYKQTNIRANHIAVVPRGRAGKAVAINDSDTVEQNKKESRMSKKEIAAKAIQAMAKDGASVDEIASFMEMMDVKTSTVTKDEATDNDSLFTKFMKAFTGKTVTDSDDDDDDEDEEAKKKKKEAEDKKAKDKAKDRAAKAAADEDEGDNAAEKKAVGEEIEDLVEAILEDEPTTDADEDEDDDDEERKKKKKEAEDAYMRSALKAIKPVIASMPKKYQAIAKDAVAKNFKRDTAGNSQTATILKSTNKSKKTVDAATIQAQAAEDIKNARQLWHEAQKSNQA